ncbi:MAG: hypothetical protein ACI8W7_001248, partial [Gammaproteobacteria bacterium]
MPGFGLTVGKQTKTFIVMYGTARKLKTLGRYPDKSLADARKQAKRYLVTAPVRADVQENPAFCKRPGNYMVDMYFHQRAYCAHAQRGV